MHLELSCTGRPELMIPNLSIELEYTSSPGTSLILSMESRHLC